MRKISTNSDLMTTREAGEVLGVAVRTIQLWVESGVLPAWRTAGGHRRIARSAVERLNQARSRMLVESDAAASVSATLPSARQPLKLLLVEDDANLRKLFSLVVQGWDCPVELRTASNGFQGLVCIGQWLPDLVVSDLNMPGINGFEMVRALQKTGPDSVPLQLVVLTAWSQAEIDARGGLPADVRVFHKPLNFDALELLVSGIQASGPVA